MTEKSSSLAFGKLWLWIAPYTLTHLSDLLALGGVSIICLHIYNPFLISIFARVHSGQEKPVLPPTQTLIPRKLHRQVFLALTSFARWIQR